jgi:hypothetical protein
MPKYTLVVVLAAIAVCARASEQYAALVECPHDSRFFVAVTRHTGKVQTIDIRTLRTIASVDLPYRLAADDTNMLTCDLVNKSMNVIVSCAPFSKPTYIHILEPCTLSRLVTYN